MAKHLIFLFLSLSLFSCASRKVAINKNQVETHIDSSSVEKRDSVSVVQNAISIKEDIHEMEIVPTDSTKPLIIDGKQYFNATIRIKRTQKHTVDSSKSTVSKSSLKQTTLKKSVKEKSYNKTVDKKANYFVYLWLLLIPAIAWLVKKFVFK
jgi:thymidine kinase